jgi:SAM-dependent methyltransferase
MTRAPNRVLDLAELQRPAFARLVQELASLASRDPVSYLHPSKRWEYPWAMERAQLAQRSRVLDAGCGASVFPIWLARHGHDVTGVDLNTPRGLDRLHDTHVDYVDAGITALPFADNSFDAVFCISVIEHLGHDGVPAALAELRRVARPGSRLLITTDYYESADARLEYRGELGVFPVEWAFFDETLLRRYLLDAPGLRVDGAVDLAVDWDRVRATMPAFHGYPYTSIGVALIKVPDASARR